MNGLELYAAIAFAVVGAGLCALGLAFYLASREIPSVRFEVDLDPLPVRARPRLYDWDAEGDFR